MKKNQEKILVIGLALIVLVATIATFIYISNYTNISIFKNVERETSLALKETVKEGELQKFNFFGNLLSEREVGAPVAIENFTIAYDIEEPTDQDVTATITFENENVVITNNGGNNTYTFSENGSFTFEFKNENEEIGTAVATVNWIYKEAPKATITYSTTDPTNQDVTATISFPGTEVFVITTEPSYTFTENGEHVFTYEDEFGHVGTAVAKVNWIYKEAPKATIKYSTTELTNQDVTATVLFDNTDILVIIDNDTYTFTENGEHVFTYEDEFGNVGTAVATVNWIDKTAPVATIGYSEVDPTNQDVTATISFDKENVRITNNEGSNTYTFTEKGEFTFEFVDEAGNTGTAVAKVTWIYKEAPKARIKYSTTEPTRENVTATVVFDNLEIFVIMGEDSYTFTENGEHIFEYEDEAGNQGTVVARVDWIYKEAPKATIEYNIDTLTNQDVVATITFDRENVTITNNEGNNTYTFEENGEFIFEYVDSLGNAGTTTVTVDWIDKTAPVATIGYSEVDPTNQDVTATISFDKENVRITNNEGSNTYTFTEKGEFTFEFVDEAGNTGTAVAKVTWIYKEAPKARIKYSTTEPTRENVTATVVFDNLEIFVIMGEDSYTFTENGEHIFEYEDEAGNQGTVVARVDWIYKEAPKATIEYNIDTLTNQDVVATITFDRENVTITNNEGNNTYTFEENGEFIFEYVDSLGNAGTTTVTVDWIDKTAPVATIGYSEVDPTNQDVTATISFDKENVRITNNEGSNTYTFTEKGEFTFEFVDEAGNTGTAVAKVTWIYKEAPKATIKYSTTEPTNGDVTAEIYFKDVEIFVIIVNDKYTFTENGEHTFYYEDEAGNQGSATAKVDWIYKGEPKATIEYSETNLTNQDVTATITFDRENVTITNNEGNNTYTFEENGEFTFEYADLLGNTGTTTVTVDWIDKVAPVATIEYSTTEATREDVTATISFDKENVRITNNEGSNTYTFTENGEFTFEFEDAAGNTGTAVARVDWIYKEAPIATIEYDINTLTNQDVTATITFDRENVIVTGGNTHTFTENGEYTFEFEDAAGNTGTALAEVDWIDKVVPVATIEYDITELTNQDVRATITFDKENVTVTGGDTYTFTENGEYTFEYTDAAGNTGRETASVDWIDKVVANATIEYSTTTATRNDVTVTVTFDKENVTILNNDGFNTYTFTENAAFTFEYIDEAGNRGTADAMVTWIDKEAPIATLEYSTIEATNEDVTVTITFDEENVIILNNEGSNTYTFEENGEFTFEFEDQVGNVGTAVAEVDWIDKELPTARIEYSTTEETKDPVTVRLVDPSKDITIINNNGSDTYTFNRNGTFTFIIEDELGNRNEITATVSWIDTTEIDSEVTSDEYKIENGYIKNIKQNTKVEDFKKNINVMAEVIIKDKNGKMVQDDEIMATGMKVFAGINIYTGVVTGDMDGNGKITITDLAKLCLHYIDKELLKDEYKEAADVDGNNKISINDLAKLQLILIGKNK